MPVMANSTNNHFTVGAVAARTGVSVRTLHHYDAINLLRPSGRTETDYRLYSDDDIRRLEQIVLLRGVGMMLDDIAQVLSGDSARLLDALELRASALREQLADGERLLGRVNHMVERL